MTRNGVISFPVALKKMLGRGYMSYPEMLVGLNREGAMNEFPPLQYMMQAMPATGFLRPLMMAESLSEVERLSHEFVRLTGFNSTCADYFFKSFAYANGLLTDEPSMPILFNDAAEVDGNGEGVAESHAQYSAKDTSIKWEPLWSDEEKCRFVTRLITINRENERRLGLRVSAVSCVAVSKYNFRLTAELSRIEPDATGALYYAIYTSDETIAEIGSLGVVCYDDVSPLPKEVIIPVAPQDVTKILIYWLNE